MNKKRKRKWSHTWSGEGKTAVFAMIERNIPDRPKVALAPWWCRRSRSNSSKATFAGTLLPATWFIRTDTPAYKQLSKHGFIHEVVDHHAFEYVRGHVHTNSIESFFSVLKRTFRGTYIAPRAKHLQRYVQEQVWRFNERENTDGPRFIEATRLAEGKRADIQRANS